MDERFMLMAVEKAWEGFREGQEPFGACVVRDGEVVSVCHNTVRGDVDVSAHAEMNALREACRGLGTVDLSGCEVYATLKPCDMCMEACRRAKVSAIFYGAGPEDVTYPARVRTPRVTGGVLKESCLELAAQKYPVKLDR